MAAIDAAAPEPVEELIDRAGRAVARARRADAGRRRTDAGRDRDRRAGEQRGRRPRRRRTSAAPRRVGPCSTSRRVPTGLPAGRPRDRRGLRHRLPWRREWIAPDVGAARVLAVDIPSGVDARRRATAGAVLAAERTVTFQALKPGLLFGDGVGTVPARSTSSTSDSTSSCARLPRRAGRRRGVVAAPRRGRAQMDRGSTRRRRQPGDARCRRLCCRGGAASRCRHGARSRARWSRRTCRDEVVAPSIADVDWAGHVLDDSTDSARSWSGPGLGRRDDRSRRSAS